jgi:two-component system sensor histidine kinase UhpB
MKVCRELEGRLPSLTPEVELVIYRVAQEALTNAVRHSQASQVTVALKSGPEGVLLSVADDGRGLPEALPQAAGLTGMRERAILIQADLEIASPPGEGVEVCLTLPIPGDGT